MKLLLQFASGPLAFLVLYLAPYQEPSPEGRIALAIFGWMVVWWMTQPVPWAITAFLPILLFPGFGLMKVSPTIGLYGQNIFFWIMGTVLMGYAMQRHGLAKRFALWFLSRPVVGANTNRLVFGFMLVTALVSVFISNAATVAMMMPVGISLVAFVRTIAKIAPSEKSNLGALMALGALYGAVAGGTASMMGTPYNALSVGLAETLTGQPFAFFSWMGTCLPIFLLTLLAFYGVLRLFLKPEITTIPGGEAFIQGERDKLGALSAGERATLFVFLVMVFLFTLPTLIDLTLGPQHGVAIWADTALSIWVVPPAVMLLLFSVPVNWGKGEFILTWREAVDHAPWAIMILCTGAVGATTALVDFGFVELAKELVASMGLGQFSLPYVSALIVAVGTNFLSGTAATALFGTILIPASQQIGFDPFSMAMLIPNVATGIILPWAGATAGTAFATGEVDMKNMIRIGAVATVVFSLLVTTLHLLLAPIF